MRIFVVILCLGILLAFPAHAKDVGLEGLDVQLYQPATTADGFFGVENQRVLAKGHNEFKFSQNLGLNKLLMLTVNGAARDVVDTVATANFTAAFGITDFFTLAVDVPLHVYVVETDVTTSEEFVTGAFGDARVAAKFRLFNGHKLLPGISAVATSTLPTGSEMKWLGHETPTPGADLLFGWTSKVIDVTGNIGARLPFDQVTVGTLTFDETLRFGLGLRAPLWFVGKSWHVLAEGQGQMQLTNSQSATSPLWYLGGVSKSFNNGLILTAGAGGALTNAVGNPRFRAVAGLSYAFPKMTR